MLCLTRRLTRRANQRHNSIIAPFAKRPWPYPNNGLFGAIAGKQSFRRLKVHRLATANDRLRVGITARGTVARGTVTVHPIAPTRSSSSANRTARILPHLRRLWPDSRKRASRSFRRGRGAQKMPRPRPRASQSRSRQEVERPTLL